ncbi:PepSY domain-containing protein [Kushneria phosphatilytica]|nr:PepSY domain-containing protein [Kushneria phosphatilytica]OHV10920.1 hypothetical protein BH688_08205 [Kushneria phosphatilytica]
MLLAWHPVYGCPAGVQSHSEISQDEVLRLTESGHIRPFGEILDRARHHRSGKLLEADLECLGDRYVYEVEILDHDGRIWELRFDARTGDYLSAQKD